MAVCASGSCALGPKREGQRKLGSRRRLRDRALCLSKRRPGPSSLTTSAPPLPPCLSLSPEPKTPQARRAAVVRISALAQRAEYIWFDGLEGAPEKVRCFVFSFFSPHFPFERESREREEKRRGKKKERPENPHPRPLKKEKEKKTPPHPPKSKPQGTVFNEMRSKTKVIQKPVTSGNPKDFPDWSFDGSSTGQAEGNNSDCILNPVAVYPDPVRGGQDVLVMCEVLNPDSTPHSTNTRAALAALIDAAVRFFLSPETFLLDRGFSEGSLLFLLSPSAPPLPCLLSSFSFPPPLSLPVRSSPRPRSTASSRSTPCSPTRATSTAGRRGVTPPPRARSTAAWARRPCTAGRSPRRTW